jgi:hypothetical protein
MINIPSRFLALLGIGAAVLSGPFNAFAGRIDLQDAAFDNIADSNYFQNGMDGQWWHTPDTSVIGPTTSNLSPLVLDFGSGPITGIRFQFTQGGRVNFLDSAGNPTGDFIDPMHASSGYASDYNNGHYTDGLLDPSYLTATTLPNGAFNPANGLAAFRFSWDASCPNSLFSSQCNPNGFVSYQAVIIEIDPEDFQLQFNYLNNPTALALAAAANEVFSGSFSLGANTATYSGPFLDSGPNFCFHDGNLVTCNAVTAVPEPDTLPLAAIGLMGLVTMAWRRRRVADPAIRVR